MGGNRRAGSLKGWILSIISLSFGGSLSLQTVSAQIGDPSQDREGRMSLAEAWAPVIFQDMAREAHANAHQIEPSDALVDLFFYDSESVRENGDAIFRVSRQDWSRVFERPPVYFSVIESQTHFYINYFLYHALDTNTHWHVHDTENIWVIVRKSSSGAGELEGVVTNAHGRPMIYGVSEAMKTAARKVSVRTLDRRFLKFLDRNSLQHHQPESIEFVQRSGSASIKLFSSARSHAIYKFSSKGNFNDAVIYLPHSCGECLEDSKGYRNFLVGYNLVDFDLVMQKVVDSEHKSSIFVRVESDPIQCSSQYQGRDLPNYLAPGWEEAEPAANLFFVNSFKTPFTLADPASVHSFMTGDSGISSDYIYNYYLNPVESEVVRANPPAILKRASVWGIASMLFQSEN